MNAEQSVAIVAGVGPGLGASLCRSLATAGYAVAGLARSVPPGKELVADIHRLGGRMSAYGCDVTDGDAVAATFSRIEGELGPPTVFVYNAGRFLMCPTAETPPDEFRALWELNCFGAFLCARRAVPRMLEQGRGTIIFTGATASVKAAGNFAAFGSAKFALRGLAQAMARELGPLGIHVAHVVIDGIIWTARSRELHGVTEDQCLNPDAIAETCLQLVRQDRSAWTHELDIRPDVESF